MCTMFLFFCCLCSCFVITASNQEANIVQICKQCPELKKTSHVFLYCESVNTSGSVFINQSCCINRTSASSAIIGLDWSSCGLHTIKGDLDGLNVLQELMLENNTDLKLTTEDFDGLTELQYLSLPSGSECPGGNESWASTESSNNSVICLTELNLCIDHNVTCPNNKSHCVLTAPGKMECSCNHGYDGYKCLRQGTFPTAVYTIILCVCTVIIAGFLWCTQRRKVIKVQ